MAAVYVTNLVINTYSDFSQNFYLGDENTDSLNLTNYQVASQMRKHVSSSSFVGLGASIVNASTGQIRVGLTSTQTGSIKPGRYLYDVVVTNPQGVVSKVIEGMVLVREGITR
jgi:hypothetical protein